MGDPLPPGQDSLQSILNLHRDSRNENVASTSGSTLDSNINLEQENVNEHDLKRDYLRLLPTSQIIEICLSFDPHVPTHVKSTIWPADLNVAIAALQSQLIVEADSHSRTDHPPEEIANNRPTPVDTPAHHDLSQQANPPNNVVGTVEGGQSDPPNAAEDPPSESLAQSVTSETGQSDSIASLQKVLEELSRSNTPIQVATPSAASPPAQPANVPEAPPPQASTSQTPTPSSAPQPSTATQSSPPSHPSTPHQPHPVHPYAPYAYHPYGYPIPTHPGHHAQHPYHTPYYGAPPGHATPYTGYPPYPPHPGYPPPTPASMYGSRPPMAHIAPPSHHPTPAAVPAPPPPPPSGDDLPSYEDMIVEALVDMVDPEGAAPRELFTWMEARYPLQTNFRPSASQALQKAFKRGRLEKRPGGKYRLNASWEGGATSKRTTRRPQTLAQTNYSLHHPPTQTSPFTTAPLARGARGASVAPTPGTAVQHPYGTYPYGYPYGGYPGYPGYPPQQTTSKTTTPTPASTSTTTATSSTPAKPTTDQTRPDKGQKATEDQGPSDGAEHGDAWEAAQHILNVINFNSLEEGATSSAANAGQSASTSQAAANIAMLSDEHRASLQAQLALLATQLSELAEMDEDEEVDGGSTSAISAVPPPTVAIEQSNVLLDVNRLLEISQTHSQFELPPPSDIGVDDDDSDEDMEMVEVPVAI